MEIVSIFPVLLQLALVHFFAGLLVLLWHLQWTVAVVAGALVGVVDLNRVIETAVAALIVLESREA